MNNTRHRTRTLLAVALVSLGAATAVTAQSLNARIYNRPLSPQEIANYTLGGAQISSGLDTMGVGQPAYLEAQISSSIAPSDIVSVVWSVTGKPAGSAAAPQTSPLGTNVPIYKQFEREDFQVAGRTMLRPDIAGKYTVQASITTTTTNVVVSKLLTAGTFLGAPTCAFCHTASPGIPATFATYTNTPHAHAFELAINGISTDHFNQNCIACHVVGFDKNTNAVNGGWDDVAAQLGWMFPTNISTNNFASMPASLQHLSNVQCENCHGAGSEHAIAAITNVAFAKSSISVTYDTGSCAQCHDRLTHHFKTQEWNNSAHARSPEELSSGCARCHTGEGFTQFVQGETVTSVAEYTPIGCQTCHDPHDAANPHQTRPAPDVTLMDGITTVTDGGMGKLCMNCHIARRDAVSYVETSSVNSRFGPHHGPQTDMMVGANAITYGKDIPSAAHREVVEDTCVTCHMQERHNGDAGFTHVGGHTWNLHWDNDTPSDPSDDVELTESCTQCHGEIETFNLKRQDYDGNGIVMGVQDEVKSLMDKVAMLLPPYGQPTVSPNNSYTMPERKALYNYMFVLEDGSYGVHNVSYAVGLLKASIGDLTGDSNGDGVADAWQIQYFGAGFATNAAAGPNAINNPNGIANWMMAALNLNPSAAFSVDGTGVLYYNNGTIENGATNTVAIYTAAEVVFNTEAGKIYQIQGISAFPGVWQNISTNIPGTGAAVSYLTPTRNDGQMFFRVISTP